MRHNEVWNLIADLITEVCPDVAVEPLLAAIDGEVFTAASTNTAGDARSDIRVRERGFWTRAQDTFLDVPVLHPDEASYAKKPTTDLLLQHDRQKKLQYNERIVYVDHRDWIVHVDLRNWIVYVGRRNFTPLVLYLGRQCVLRLCAVP